MHHNFDKIIKDSYLSFSKGKGEIPFNNVPNIDSRISLYLSEQLVQRPPKDNADILREYESDKWGALLSDLLVKKDFSHKSCMDQFYGNRVIPMYFINSVYEASVLEYQEIVTALISDFIKELAGDTPVGLLELGCGFGGTLMGVSRMLASTTEISSVIGLDISSSGLEILNRMSEVEGISVKTAVHDFGTEIPLPKIGGKTGCARFAFTNFSLACLSNYSTNPISNILQTSGANYLIVFEPLLMSESNLNFSSYFTDAHIRANSYNSDIKKYIEESVDEGFCDILSQHCNVIGTSIASSISFCVLKSKFNLFSAH